MKKSVPRLRNLLAIYLFSLVSGSYNLCAQDPRPGIECGCATYGQYVSPALEAPKMGGEDKLGLTSAPSPSGKYLVRFEEGQLPLTLNISITITENNALIYSNTVRATDWGFSPDEKYFVIEGTGEATGEWATSHWVELLNLDPDKSTEGELAQVTLFQTLTAAYLPEVQFSPHGHYLMYAYITGQQNLYLQVFKCSDGSLIFDGSTNSIVEAYNTGSNAGWGFSSDEKDATFVLTYLTGAQTFALFVKRLGTADGNYIFQESNMTDGAYWRFSPCGDYFAYIDESVASYRHFVRFFSTADGTEYQGVDAEWFKHLEYTEEGHYLVMDNEGLKVRIDLPMANGTCPDRDAPTWPSGAILDTANLEGTRINLYWPPANDSFGVSAYKIYAGSQFLEELSAEDTAFLVRELLPETPYILGVSAGDETGNWSSKLTRAILTPADNPPWWPYEAGIAQGPDLELLTSTEVPLFWTPAADDFGVLGYALSIHDTPHDTIYGRSEYLFKKLEPDMSYTFSVQAYDAAGNWSPILTSELISTKPDHPPEWPSPDSELSFRDVTETTIPLHWPHADDDFGVTGYEVYMDGEFVHKTSGNDTSYTVTGLEEGTVYSFAIVARDTWINSSDTLKRNISTLSPFIEKPLMVGYGSQTAPDIHDHIIVWEDNRNGDYDIYMYNLKTRDTTRVTDNPADQRNPRVWRDWIVWEDHRNGNKDIYLYDPILGERAICTDPSDQSSPDIYGSDIVWSDARNGDTDIYLYDLEKGWEIVICDAAGNQNTPSISKNRFIVWQDHRNGNPDIYMNKGFSMEEAVVCNNSGIQSHPVIWSECRLSDIRIAYADKRSTTWDIYLYYPYYLIMDEVIDWTMKLPLDSYSTGYSNQELPHLEGDKLVYLDDRGGEPHIYEWEIVNKTQGEYSPVCLAEGGQYSPRTSKGRIVWPDFRNGNWDLYIWDRPPGSDLQLSIEENDDPIHLGDDIVYTLKVINDGPDDAERVIISCTIPDGLLLLGSTIPGHTAARSGNVMVCEIPLFPVGDTLTWTLQFRTTKTGRVTFTAKAEGDFFDPDPSNNTISETTDVSLITREVLPAKSFFGMDMEPDGTVHMTYKRNDTIFYAYRNNHSGWKEEYIDFSDNNKHNLDDWFEGYLEPADLLLDRSGRVKAVCVNPVYNFYERDSTYYYLYYYVKNGDVWKKQLIGLNQLGFGLPDIEPAQNDNLHLMYGRRFNHRNIYPYRIYYTKQENQQWVSRENLPGALNVFDFCVDSKLDPHISYTSYTGEDEQPTWHRFRNATGSWEDTEIIDPAWGERRLSYEKTIIAMDREDQPHFCYYDGDSRRIRLATLSEEEPTFITVDSGYNLRPCLIDPDFPDGKSVVYEKNGDLIFAFNHSGSWVRHRIAQQKYEWRASYSNVRMERDNEENCHIAFVYLNEGIFGPIEYIIRPPLPYIIANTDLLDFGMIEPGESNEKYCLISNPSSDKVKIDSLSIEGSIFFKVLSEHSVLKPGESDTVKIVYAPSEADISEADLKIWFNGTEFMYVDLRLKGCTPAPIMDLTPDKTRFDALIGESDSCRYYICNRGALPLEIYEVKVEYKQGGSTVTPTDFDLVSNNCSLIEPGDSCSILVVFSPNKDGSQTTRLYITSNSINDPDFSIGLRGNIAKPLRSLSTFNLDFGYVENGSSKQKDITLTNTGTANLEVASVPIAGTNPDVFTAVCNGMILEPGESCPVTVGFHPVTEGDFEAELKISSNASDAFVNLAGSSYRRELTVNVDALDFGSVPVDQNSSGMYIEVTNAGAVVVENIAVGIDGDHIYEFRHSEFPLSLQPGESFTDTIWFSPLYEGEKNAWWIISQKYAIISNDSVLLKGIGKGEPRDLCISAGADPVMGILPLDIDLFSTPTGGTLPYTIHWEFGDGVTSDKEDPMHTYQQTGKYYATVKVTDQEGAVAIDSVLILAGSDDMPALQIYAFEQLKDTLLEVQFVAEIVGGEGPFTLLWDFGDGTTGNILNPVHTYSHYGDYLARLRLTDVNANTVSDSLLIQFEQEMYTLSGKVYSQDSTVLITSGTASLYAAGAGSNAEPVFEYSLTSEGGYLFGELASDSYRVKITPDTMSFPGYLPTYSGGVLTLYEAEVMKLAGNETLNIYCLKNPDEGSGLGSISGEVLSTFRKAGMKLEYDYQGDGTPIPGIMVYLKEHEADLLKGADLTGTQGDFSFNGLEDGLYNMMVDYRGIQMNDDNTILEVGSDGRDVVVNALVSADEISVKVVVIGIESRPGTFGAWCVYPNPNDGVFCVIIEGLSLHGFLKIVDNSGRIVYDNKYVTGDYINLEFLESGIYLLNFRYNDSIYYSKLIIN